MTDEENMVLGLTSKEEIATDTEVSRQQLEKIMNWGIDEMVQ